MVSFTGTLMHKMKYAMPQQPPVVASALLELKYLFR